MQVTSTKPLSSALLSAEDKSKNNLIPVKSGGEAAASSSSSTARPDFHAINLKSRNKEWSGLTEAQSRLSRLQSMSETFHYTQNALLGLAREMTSKLPQSSRILHEISVLKSRLDSQNQVDENFLPKTSNPKSSYKLDRMDILASKDQSEQIQVRLPDNSQVNLSINKFQSSESILKDVSAKFRDVGIKVERGSDDKLIFTGPDKLMDSAWIFQGQGIRIPAGNPVPLSLEKLPDPLSDLSKKVFSEDFEASREKLREILTDISQKIKVIDKETNNLLTKNMSVPEEKTAESLGLSDTLKEKLTSGDRMVNIQALISQANVPRDHVVDILTLD